MEPDSYRTISRNDDALGFSRFGDASYGRATGFHLRWSTVHPSCLDGCLRSCARGAGGIFHPCSSASHLDIVTVAFRNRNREGVLTQAGLDKTTERDRRQRGSQSKSNFRMHARDEKELSSAMQAFYYIFAMFLLHKTRPVLHASSVSFANGRVVQRMGRLALTEEGEDHCRN